MASELDKQFLDRLKRLPPDRQREVLDFVEFLERKTAPAAGRTPLRGIFADLGVSLSAEEIDEDRREAWSGFPREDV
jgi:hypothetical protein